MTEPTDETKLTRTKRKWAAEGKFLTGKVVRGEVSLELRALDPAASFVQSRVGQLLFSSYDTDECRRVLFDNRSGTFTEAGTIYCGQIPEADRLGQERAQQMLKSFRK